MHIVGLFVAVCLVAAVAGEQCTSNSNCVSTTCQSGKEVICQHPDGAGVVDLGGLCTCSDVAAGKCVLASDCYGSNAPNLQCPDDRRHCYDGACVCSRFPTGGK